MKISFKGKEIDLDVVECRGIGMARGLMFSRRENAKALLFETHGKMPLHSFFVFFPFFVLWLDEKNEVLEDRKVKPFEFFIDSKKNYSKIIEIPTNKKYFSIINFLVGEKFK